MDVTTVLSEIVESREIDYAVVGGFALLAYRIQRATFDLDLVTRIEAQDEVVGFLEARG